MATTFRNDLYNAYPSDSMSGIGKNVRRVRAKKTFTSGTSAIGDVFILGGPFTVSDRIDGLYGAIPAFTSANSNDLGFYVKNLADGTFAPYSTAAATALWSAVDLTSAKTFNEQLTVLNTSLDLTKNIGDLCSLNADQQPVGGLYVGLRFNVANTASSAILNLSLEVEQANTK